MPPFGKICRKCLKKNHFPCACRSNKVVTEKVHQVGDSSDEEDSDDEYAKKITIRWMRGYPDRQSHVQTTDPSAD